MEVPSTIPADQRESSSARTSLSTTDIATFSAAGGHILQTDFLVDQEVDISVGSLFVRESFPKARQEAMETCSRAAHAAVPH